jgi:hypothetical protein
MQPHYTFSKPTQQNVHSPSLHHSQIVLHLVFVELCIDEMSLKQGCQLVVLLDFDGSFVSWE